MAVTRWAIRPPAEVALGNGQFLQTVTSDVALNEVGDKLHNCVGVDLYGQQLRQANRLIAVLTTDKGKPLACGEWLGNRWGQIAGPCNQQPDAVIVGYFKGAAGKQLTRLAFAPPAIAAPASLLPYAACPPLAFAAHPPRATISP